MDVARIEAISPKKIDWRKLTSKEIIKYDAQGVDVPPEYLQWAKSFRADLEASDKDETTYEMANSTAAQQTSASEAEKPVETDAENSDDTSVTDDTVQTEEQPEEEKTAAQQKRQDLQDSGVSLRNQARVFTSDSKEASKATLEAAAVISSTEDKSVSEIQSLENYMETLLSEAEATQNELKSEVDNINNNKNDASSFAKINRLEKQLERYGTQAQSNISSSEVNFNNFETTIAGQTDTILNSEDFGTETVNVGNELIASRRARWTWLLDVIIGRIAVRAGERAINVSQSTADLQTQASGTNSSNLSEAQSYKTQVENKTGVAGITLTQESDNQTNQETNDEGEKSTDSSKSVTETDKAASANLDQVLQSKIKKGENINNT